MVEQITFLAVISYKVLVVIRLFGIVIFGTVVTHIEEIECTLACSMFT